jgi:hypothetical protein
MVAAVLARVAGWRKVAGEASTFSSIVEVSLPKASSVANASVACAERSPSK